MSSDHCRWGWAQAGRQEHCGSGGQKWRSSGAGVGKTSADHPALPGCNYWGICEMAESRKSSCSPELLCQVRNSLLAVLNGLRLFLSRKPGVSHQVALLSPLLQEVMAVDLLVLKTYIIPSGVLPCHWQEIFGLLFLLQSLLLGTLSAHLPRGAEGRLCHLLKPGGERY